MERKPNKKRPGRKIYPENSMPVAEHNVIGEHGLLWSAEDILQDKVGAHYDPRAVDQLMYSENKHGVVLSPDESHDFQEQLRYRGAIAEAVINSIKDISEIKTEGASRALYIPYVRMADPTPPNGVEWGYYGLPPEVTRSLKNKAEFHNWLSENGYSQHIPNYRVCNVEEMTQVSYSMLRQINEMYKEVGVDYPPGLMIRAAESDGNFGSGYLVQANKDKFVGDKLTRKGDILFMPDGKSKDARAFTDWEGAIKFAQQHVTDSMNLASEPRVVLTRFLDLESTPGQSAVVTEGTIHCLNWNGQWVEPGDSACTGTTSYGLIGNEKVEEKYFEQGREMFTSILSKHLNEAEREEVYGMANIDFMVVGKKEKELWQKVTSNERLRRRYLHTKKAGNSFQPNAYNPDNLLIAEINPRDTNWTLALKAVLPALGRQHTLKALTNLASGNEIKIATRDAWTLPEGVSAKEAREKLFDFHQQLKREGAGFILRMPDNPAGIIAWTHDNPSKVIRQAEDYLL